MPSGARRHVQEVALEELAARSGVLTRYTDGLGKVRRPSDAVIRQLCLATGHEQSGGSIAPTVATVGSRSFPIAPGPGAVHEGMGRLSLEEGGEMEVRIERNGRAALGRTRAPVPLGVHRLLLPREAPNFPRFVLVRPESLAHFTSREGRRLAVFLPLYAAAPGGPAGIATYRDLRELCEWADRAAGALVGTLPLFPAFLARPFDPSPYAPVSRLMWNELYVELRESPEWSVAAGMFGGSRARAARPGTLVDYRSAWTAARGALRTMAAAARASPRRWAEVLSGVSAETMRYAVFRAAVDATGVGWNEWPAAWRAGRIDAGRVDPRDVDLYVYAQSLAGAQLRSLARSGASKSPLYLDLPVGVHANGFDTYSRPDLFLHGWSAGAPPDELNAHGQIWGFPPLHPRAGRSDGYAHLRAVLRRLFGVARVLRIDHVMGLYRMYCVPRGLDGRAGAYLRYPEEELFAVVMIEAARAGATVVGEDLGTVPAPVRRVMKRFGILGMHVQQFAFGGPSQGAIQPAGDHVLATLNTHDTPTFAGFWNADDVSLRLALGQIDRHAAAKERRARTAVRRAVAAELTGRNLPCTTARDAALSIARLQCRGKAPIVLVNLEDLWGERRPQNVPGTPAEHPNWRRRAARSMRSILNDRAIAARLASLRRELRGRRKERGS